MTVFASIGVKALYLLFLWLISATIASWLSDRKGYGERVGLTFGLILSVIGLVLVLILPARPGSKWKVEGPIPKRRRQADVVGPALEEPPGGGGPPESNAAT